MTKVLPVPALPRLFTTALPPIQRPLTFVTVPPLTASTLPVPPPAPRLRELFPAFQVPPVSTVAVLLFAWAPMNEAALVTRVALVIVSALKPAPLVPMVSALLTTVLAVPIPPTL